MIIVMMMGDGYAIIATATATAVVKMIWSVSEGKGRSLKNARTPSREGAPDRTLF